MKIKRHFLKYYRKLLAHPNPWVRRSIGIALVLAGIVGPVLPILGLWMLPLGVILLIVDIPQLRPARRRYNAWWRKKLQGKKPKRPATDSRPPNSPKD